MYRITFVLNLFKGEQERELSEASLTMLLMGLMHLDILYLKAHPETPDIYRSHVRYAEEPPGQEDWQDIPTTIKLGWGDCLPLDTLVLKQDYSLVPIAKLVPGDIIMGDGVPTTVLEAAVTGIKPVLAFDLDNGCTLRCTPEHRLFLQDGSEVQAKDIAVGSRLKSPEKLSCSEQAWTPDARLSPEDMAWLTGVYVADGWNDKNGHRFCISGDEENPKRGKIEQKDRVQKMMDTLGVHVRRAQKYVAVSDTDLGKIMIQAGSLAPRKHMPSMMLTEPQVRAALEGLKTDASVANSGTITHGTVSETLALQTRILYRMLGQSVHIRRWDEHGGLGENPIYRITVRQPASADSPKNWQTRAKDNADSVKVRGVREIEPTMCCDITTDTGRFYLPESDVVVHNCEDLACWRAAELRVRHGVNAVPTFICKLRPNGGYLYHILVKYPDGRIEDPSRALGMR